MQINKCLVRIFRLLYLFVFLVCYTFDWHNMCRGCLMQSFHYFRSTFSSSLSSFFQALIPFSLCNSVIVVSSSHLIIIFIFRFTLWCNLLVFTIKCASRYGVFFMCCITFFFFFFEFVSWFAWSDNVDSSKFRWYFHFLFVFVVNISIHIDIGKLGQSLQDIYWAQ